LNKPTNSPTQNEQPTTQLKTLTQPARKPTNQQLHWEWSPAWTQQKSFVWAPTAIPADGLKTVPGSQRLKRTQLCGTFRRMIHIVACMPAWLHG